MSFRGCSDVDLFMTGFAVMSSRSSVRLYRDPGRWRTFFTVDRIQCAAR